jgi:hypothetical protein
MADVSVEFGAKDTGLEQTLKTVQDELTRLNEEVKSGELSFDELQRAMRDISKAEKVQDQLMGMAEETRGAGDAADAATPKVGGLGNEAQEMGAKVESAGQDSSSAASMFDESFAKMSAAFAVGNIAAKGFQMAVNAVFSAARAAVDGFGEALDLGARLNALSQQTGESAGKVLVLETAFKNAHISADQVGTTINRLQNFMAQAEDSGSKQASTMGKLGISMADLAGKTPTQQMEVFAERISAIEDPTQRVAAATDVFGQRLGGRLLPLFNDFSANLDDARGKVGSLEQVMDENAATFDAAGNTIDAIKGKFAAFAAGLLSETIPAVQDLGTSMEQVDAAGLGQKIGSALNPVLKDLSGLVYDARLLIDGLAYAEQQAREDTGALGVAFNAVDGALKGFNQALIDGLRFITPFDETLDALEKTFVGTKAGVEGAADAIDEFGDQATDAASEVDKLGESLGGIPPKLDDIAEAENNIKSAIQDQADEKKKSIQHQIDLNRAIAEGNVEEQSRIQALIDAEKAQERILKLTDEYIKSGLGVMEAQALAASLVESAGAARDIEKNIKKTNEHLAETPQHTDKIKGDFDQMMRDMQIAGSATGGLSSGLSGAVQPANNLAGAVGGVSGEAKTLKEHIDQINQEKMEVDTRPFRERLNEVRGDLDYLLKDLLGTSVQNVDLSSLISKFGLLSNGLDGPEIKLEQLNRLVKALQEADPAQVQIIVDEMGSAEKKMRMLGDLAREQFEGIDATPRIDREAVGEGVNWTKDTIETALAEFKPKISPEVNEPQLNSVVEEIRQEIESSLGEPVTLDLEGERGRAAGQESRWIRSLTSRSRLTFKATRTRCGAMWRALYPRR